MDFLSMVFPISGVETYVFIPPLVAFVISFFASMGGLSGAFLLLPFQMSVLHFTTPSVSATNFLFNIVAIPGGVLRFIKEGRMAWPLTWVIVIGTVPGVFIGYVLRIQYVPDIRSFKFFVGCVLLYIGIRLMSEVIAKFRNKHSKTDELEKKFGQRTSHLRKSQHSRVAAGLPSEAVIKTISFSFQRVTYEFWGEIFTFRTVPMFLLSFFVGIIGGIYGIGGGAIIAPFCVTVFRLPVYTVAGAALTGTFLTSIAGIIFYTVLPLKTDMQTSPDWLLGILFGFGGFMGIYLGARLQKFMPQRAIKLILGLVVLYVSLKYILQYFV
ncbi:MAG: sulfite exporter TauE/SafE family protein [Nitrospiraceae bacterium]|nr:MAG: sulfite exporter TauE/SafE family protein [Nitrospiraceae bacterium]